MSESTMFHVSGISKSYDGTVALAPLTLTIERGETVALMGPSGGGKTTLLELLAGLTVPDEGEVYLAGRPISRLRSGRELSRLVGIMPQSLDLVPSLAVIHNVAAGRLGDWSLLRSIQELVLPRDVQPVKAALARVGVPEKIYERTEHLSGGEQQRVALARLLVQRPQAVLADEPVASVDPARAEDLISLLVSLTQENAQTLVASLHSVPLVLRYFSRIIALRRGHVVFDRPVVEVTDTDLTELYALESQDQTDVRI